MSVSPHPQAPPAAVGGEVLLEVDSVRYAYGDLVAVWEASFSARAGATVVIVGRNGAGKTTLMFGLAGVLKASSGSVRLAGADVTRWSPWRRSHAGLSLVPEGKRVFRELTIEENLALGIPRRVRGRARRARIDGLLERFPVLAEKRRQAAGSCSGGQQQLLSIASALVVEPKVLLVDEPSSGLSPVAVEDVMEALEGLKREGLAIVLVEQRIEEVVTGIADRVVVLEQGRIAIDEVPERIDLADLERRLSVA